MVTNNPVVVCQVWLEHSCNQLWGSLLFSMCKLQTLSKIVSHHRDIFTRFWGWHVGRLSTHDRAWATRLSQQMHSMSLAGSSNAHGAAVHMNRAACWYTYMLRLNSSMCLYGSKLPVKPTWLSSCCCCEVLLWSTSTYGTCLSYHRFYIPVQLNSMILSAVHIHGDQCDSCWMNAIVLIIHYVTSVKEHAGRQSRSQNCRPMRQHTNLCTIRTLLV